MVGRQSHIVTRRIRLTKNFPRKTLTKLQSHGFKASGNEADLFTKERKWLAHIINGEGLRRRTGKLQALSSTTESKSQKPLKILRGRSTLAEEDQKCIWLHR